MATPRSKRQESHVATEKLDPKEHQAGNLSEYDRATLRHCLQYEGNHERGSRTDHSLKDNFFQKKSNDISKDARGAKTRCSTSGGMLAIGPCFTVRHLSVTQAIVSLSSAESEAKATTKGCIKTVYVKHCFEHQTARPFKIEVWTDSSSANAIRRRVKHLEVQTLWVQQLSHLVEQVEYAGKCCKLTNETRSTSSA